MPIGIVIDEDPSSDQTQVRVQAFRMLLRKHPADRWAFLSYGRGQEAVYSSAGPVVIGQLADLNLKLAPASAAVIPQLGTGGAVVTRETLEPGTLYTVVITRWVDEDTAAVEATRYDKAVPASGFTGTVKRIARDIWRVDQYKPW